MPTMLIPAIATRKMPTDADLPDPVQEVGEGPPILFVHGASNGGASRASLIARLEGFHCVALDRPGCGVSDSVGGGDGLGEIDAVESFAGSLLRDVLDAAHSKVDVGCDIVRDLRRRVQNRHGV